MSPTAWRPMRAFGLRRIFGPQHGFSSDVQENMIETGHGRDEIRRVPVYSLYSETREPTAEMLRGLDVLVIDLQDVGTRIYTYIYTMANCLRAARRHGVKVIVCDRPNPIGGRRGGRADARAGIRVVRRALSDPDAARDDHRRAGAAVQRAFRHRRGPRGRDDGGLAARNVCGRDRPAVGAAVAEHPDRRQRRRLSGDRAVRRDQRLGRPRHHASRSSWSALHGSSRSRLPRR